MKKILLLAFSVAAVSANSQVFQQAGFEGGPDAPGWTQSSTNFTTPLCDAACGNCGGGCDAQAGDWYAWFGGAGPDNEEIGAVTQTITIPDGDVATLTFWTKVGNAGDSLETEMVVVAMDTDPLFTITAADVVEYDEWTEITVDVSAYADGMPHAISVVGASEQGSSILFDSFDLVVDGTSLELENNLLNREVPVTFYPNPANNQVTMTFNHIHGVASVQIFDMNGKLVSSQSFNEVFNSTFVLDTQSLQSGMYSITVENGGEMFTERITVAH